METIEIMLVHGVGGGFSGKMLVPKGMLLTQLFTQEIGGSYRQAIISLNGKKLTPEEVTNHILSPGDSVVFLAANEKNG